MDEAGTEDEGAVDEGAEESGTEDGGAVDEGTVDEAAEKAGTEGGGVEDEAAVAGWQRTLDEMEALAAERSAEGWETLTVTPADTAPVPPSEGPSDRFGLVYTVGESVAETFPAIHERGFDRYEVYRRQVGETVFLVTELQNTDRSEAVFVAGAVEMEFADDLLVTVAERGEIYTHLQTLDWTHLGSVRHDDPSAFFPSLAE